MGHIFACVCEVQLRLCVSDSIVLACFVSELVLFLLIYLFFLTFSIFFSFVPCIASGENQNFHAVFFRHRFRF